MSAPLLLFVNTLNYLVREEFNAAASNKLTIVDSASKLSVTGGKLTSTGTVTGTCDPRVYTTATYARTPGRAFVLRFKLLSAFGGSDAASYIGWSLVNDTSIGGANIMGFRGNIDNPALITDVAGTNVGSIQAYANDTYYQVILVIGTGTGSEGYLLWDDKLRWVYRSMTNTPNTPTHAVVAWNNATRKPFEVDYFRVIDTLGAPWSAAQGIATVNAASPSGTYTGAADAIIDLDLTAPGAITTEAGLYYRATDTNNAWRIYFNTSGALRIDSIAAGVATNRLNVAGVISAGQTRTLRVYVEGAKHNAITYSAITPTKQGSEVNVSHQDSATGVITDIGAGWTAANLRVYPTSASLYTALSTQQANA